MLKETELDYDDSLSTAYQFDPFPSPSDGLILEVQQGLPKYGAPASHFYLAALLKILQGKACAPQSPLGTIAPMLMADQSRYTEPTYLNYQRYLTKVMQPLPDLGQVKRTNSVLLTGATGFLGCHLLDELLRTTLCIIYLPVRGLSSQDACQRLYTQYQRYFQSSLSAYDHRIVILCASLYDEGLSLNTSHLVDCAGKIDSIIHCAAATDFLGDETEVEQANVAVTARLLEFAQAIGAWDFHFISCLGVLQGCRQPLGHPIGIITEDDDPAQLRRPTLACFAAKLRAEQLVCECRKRGVHGSIYRVSHLIAGKQTHALGDHHEQTILFAQVRAMMAVGTVPDELASLQVSEVAQTASAIVRLFEQKLLSNQIWHLFNPVLFDLRRLLAGQGVVHGDEPDLNALTRRVNASREPRWSTKAGDGSLKPAQLWSTLSQADWSSGLYIAQNKTVRTLANLGFFWSPISEDLFLRYLGNSRSCD